MYPLKGGALFGKICWHIGSPRNPWWFTLPCLTGSFTGPLHSFVQPIQGWRPDKLLYRVKARMVIQCLASPCSYCQMVLSISKELINNYPLTFFSKNAWFKLHPAMTILCCFLSTHCHHTVSFSCR